MIAPCKNTLIPRYGRTLLYLALFVLPVVALAQVDEERTVTDTSVIVEEDWQDDSLTTTRVTTADYEKETAPPPPPELRSVPDSTVNKLKDNKDFEYANNPAYWKKEAAPEKKSGKKSNSTVERLDGFFDSDGVRFFFYGLIGALLLWIIYRIIVVNNLFVTRRSKSRQTAEDDVEEVLDNSSLDARAKAAIAEGNYRAAVRFLYLKTLNGLHEKGWIRYHSQGTNFEYLNQVTPYGVGKEFRFLTHVYEYVWYGEFALREQQFNDVHRHFQQFYNSAKL